MGFFFVVVIGFLGFFSVVTHFTVCRYKGKRKQGQPPNRYNIPPGPRNSKVRAVAFLFSGFFFIALKMGQRTPIHQLAGDKGMDTCARAHLRARLGLRLSFWSCLSQGHTS